MRKAHKNYIKASVIVLCVLLLIVSVLFKSSFYKNEAMNGMCSENNIKNYKDFFNDPSASKRMTDYILAAQRQGIINEMKNFEYSKEAGQHLVLIPESGGTPYRSIIITTWRSGSTFLGELLNAMPANFYHYEPLLNFGIIQIRGQPHAGKAVQNLKNLLNCNYTAMDEYLDYGQTHKHLFSHNPRLWRYCDLYPQYFLDPNFLSPFCKLFPLQSMKVVRLRLVVAEQLISDGNLNARVVLLIRDPRGTIQSRKHREWCPGNSDCDDPAMLCKDLVSDFKSAVRLSKRYPLKFKAIRYEDLSLDPYNMTKDVLDFYGLPFDTKVKEFLNSHTRSNDNGDSTFRESKSTPFHWIRDLKYEEIDEIQGSCAEAMRLWGYQTADERTILGESFNPLLSFKLK